MANPLLLQIHRERLSKLLTTTPSASVGQEEQARNDSEASFSLACVATIARESNLGKA